MLGIDEGDSNSATAHSSKARKFRGLTTWALPGIDLTEPSFNGFWMTGRDVDEPKELCEESHAPAPPASAQAFADVYY